jgi:hypothetical protein
MSSAPLPSMASRTTETHVETKKRKKREENRRVKKEEEQEQSEQQIMKYYSCQNELHCNTNPKSTANAIWIETFKSLVDCLITEWTTAVQIVVGNELRR